MSRTRTAPLAALASILAAMTFAAVAEAAKPPFYGVVTQQTELSGADYDLMQGAGVQTVRAHLVWPTVQDAEGACQASAAEGVCDWRTYDEVIGNLAARGIEFFPYLTNVPDFVATDPNRPPLDSKSDREAWADFAAAAVGRYGPGGAYWENEYLVEHPLADPVPIRHWQVWNEPSAEPFWKPKPNAREYAKLVKLTSKAITAEDGGAYIVLAGLFGTPTVGIDQPEFLRRLYGVKGIDRHFDAVAIHPYGPDLDRVRFQVDWALDEMRRAGDRRADLWISEIGWASDRVHNQLGVGPKKQAKLLGQAFDLFREKRKNWNVASVNWYAWQDVDDAGFCDFCRRSGLVNVRLEPKPSYDAFREEAVR